MLLNYHLQMVASHRLQIDTNINPAQMDDVQSSHLVSSHFQHTFLPHVLDLGCWSLGPFLVLLHQSSHTHETKDVSRDDR